MKTIAILFTALLGLAQSAAAAGLPTAKPEEVGLSSERLARIAQVLKADMAGSPGDSFWPGAYATYFWVDPKLDLAVVSMLQAPLGRHSNPLMRSLVLQAVTQ